MAVVGLGVLAGTAPVHASVYIEPGPGAMHYDSLSARSSPGADAGACAASQCDLLEQKSAADALAMAAGAGPATPMDRPPVVADPWRKGPYGVSGGTFSTTGPKQTSDVDPVLFTVIEQSRVAQGQLCMEEGNLLGLDTHVRAS